MDRVAIADFLRRHRHALQPDDVGLPLRRRRRTAGLRREKGAALADTSPDVFPGLEQGRGARPPARPGRADALAVGLPPDQPGYPLRPAGATGPPGTDARDTV